MCKINFCSILHDGYHGAMNSPHRPNLIPDSTLFDAFARFYDEDYRAYDEDVEAIVHLANEMDGPVLELGCGTGRLLLPLAAAGHAVTGVDIAPALLAQARTKLAAAPGGARVTLVEADLRTLALPQRDFAFAFCTSNTLMHLATADDQLAALTAAAGHLRPGGLLLVDLFHPDIPRLIEVHGVQELADRWTRADGTQVVKWSVRTLDLAEQVQETLFIYEEIAPDGTLRRTLCPFALRYLWRSEAELMLRLAGLQVEAVWGDFEGTPYDNGSEHLILLATQADDPSR
jgi:SAM-dependent methyltransferase